MGEQSKVRNGGEVESDDRSTSADPTDTSDAPDRSTRAGHRRNVERGTKDSPEETKTPVYRRLWFLAAAGVFLLIAIIVGVMFYLHARSHESTDDAFIEGSAVQVSPQAEGTVTKVYVADNQWVKAGDLLAELDARDYEARLEQAKAALQAAEARHDQAKENVSLTRITSNATVEQTAAGVATASAQAQAATRGAQARQSAVEQAEAAERTSRANLEQARAEERAAAAQAERDERDVVRYRMLYSNDAVSQQRRDFAVAAARTSVAQLDAARKRSQAGAAQVAQANAAVVTAAREWRQALAQTEAARSQIGEARGRLDEARAAPQRVRVSDKQADTAEAEIAQARQTVAQAELDLSYTKIYAPEAGRITHKSIDEGQLARIGQPLMAIVYGDMWVTANFKETQLTKMRVGHPVNIKVDTYPGRTFKGHVESFQYGTGARFSVLPPQNATGNYVKVVQRIPVKILFDDPPDTSLLAPGMSVTPEVDIAATPDPNAIHRGYGTGGGAVQGTGGAGGGNGGGGSSGAGNSSSAPTGGTGQSGSQSGQGQQSGGGQQSGAGPGGQGAGQGGNGGQSGGPSGGQNSGQSGQGSGTAGGQGGSAGGSGSGGPGGK